MPSPKLKEAMAEIHAVLKKHDIAGHVLLHEPNFSEYLSEISPSWSVLKYEYDPKDADNYVRLRFKALAKDFPSQDAQKKAIEATSGMIISTAKHLGETSIQYFELADMLAEHFEIEHTQKHE